MPRKKRTTKRSAPPGDPFLRSINIRYDADRIAHFRRRNST